MEILLILLLVMLCVYVPLRVVNDIILFIVRKKVLKMTLDRTLKMNINPKSTGVEIQYEIVYIATYSCIYSALVTCGCITVTYLYTPDMSIDVLVAGFISTMIFYLVLMIFSFITVTLSKNYFFFIAKVRKELLQFRETFKKS